MKLIKKKNALTKETIMYLKQEIDTTTPKQNVLKKLELQIKTVMINL